MFNLAVFLVGVAFGAILAWAIGAVIICLFLDDGPPILFDH